MAYSTPKEVASARMEMDSAAFKLRQAVRQMSEVGPARVNPASTQAIKEIEQKLMALVDELGAYV